MTTDENKDFTDSIPDFDTSDLTSTAHLLSKKKKIYRAARAKVDARFAISLLTFCKRDPLKKYFIKQPIHQLEAKAARY